MNFYKPLKAKIIRTLQVPYEIIHPYLSSNNHFVIVYNVKRSLKFPN